MDPLTQEEVRSMVEESSGGSDASGTRPRRRSILGATLPDTRTVAVGADPKTRNKDEKAKDNVVHTTKYNAVTFFPKSTAKAERLQILLAKSPWMVMTQTLRQHTT